MIASVVLLAVGLALVLLAAELFTNGVEWVGYKLRLSEGMVGSVLAAVGTAMPETLIPIVAILLAGRGDGEHATEVGIGAILGAPFMLSTLAMFITGLAVVGFRRRRATGVELAVDQQVLGHDVRFFLMTYSLAIASAFLPLRELRLLVATGLVVLYAYYVWRHLRADAAEAGEEMRLSPLHFHYRFGGRGEPPLALVVAQTLVALGMIIGGATLFVEHVSALSVALGVSALALALVIAPIATELPEKFNSVIWVRQNKDTLALGNISGAMVFQSCLPVSFGLVFTPWTAADLGVVGLASAAAALGSTLLIFGPLSRLGKLTGPVLMSGGVWYLSYLLFLAFGAGRVALPH